MKNNSRLRDRHVKNDKSKSMACVKQNDFSALQGIYCQINLEKWANDDRYFNKRSHLNVTTLTSRSNRGSCSIRKAVLKNFAIFTGKHLCWSLSFKKLQAQRSFEKDLRTTAFEHLRQIKMYFFLYLFHPQSHFKFVFTFSISLMQQGDYDFLGCGQKSNFKQKMSTRVIQKSIKRMCQECT